MFPLIDIVRNASWIRTFTFQKSGVPVGDMTWYAEMVCLHTNNHDVEILRASTANGHAAWNAPGILTVSLSDAETNAMQLDKTDFYLKIKHPISGEAHILLSGTIDIVEPTGGKAPSGPLYLRGPSAGHWNASGYYGPWGYNCCTIGGLWMAPGISTPMPYPIAH